MVLIETHLWRYALYRAYLNLISEASRYYLGWLWWFLEPIAMTAVFFFVFTYLRPSNTENFRYFLIIGVTMWLWFANGVANSTDSLMVAKGIVIQIRLPKLLFPFISVVSASFKQIFVFATVLIVCGSIFGLSAAWFYLPIVVITQLVFILAVASSVAFVCCWVRDLRFIVRSGLTLMMFCSGLFFSIDAMPPAYQEIFRLNPMATLIEQYRFVLLSGAVPDVSWCFKITIASVLWLYLLRWAYEHFDLILTRRVMT